MTFPNYKGKRNAQVVPKGLPKPVVMAQDSPSFDKRLYSFATRNAVILKITNCDLKVAGRGGFFSTSNSPI